MDNKTKRYLETTVLILAAVAILLASTLIALTERLDIALSFALLVGVWLIDAVMKRILELSNESVFADLSFAAFIFTGSQTIDGPQADPSQSGWASTGLLLTFVIILCILWMGNVYISRGISDTGAVRVKQRRIMWTFSIVFAVLSVCLTLMIKYAEII